MLESKDKVKLLLSAISKETHNLHEYIGCYLVGSYVYGHYVEGISDIDIVIVSKEGYYEECKSIIENFKYRIRFDTDIHIFSEEYIFEHPWNTDVREIVWGAKIANYQIFGIDILQNFELPALDIYLDITLKKLREHINELKETNLTNFPEQYSYIRGKLREFVNLRDNIPSIKQMVITTSWICTFLLAQDHNIFIASKSQAIEEYKNRYEDGYIMHQLLYDCKIKWKYKPPTETRDINIFLYYCQYMQDKIDSIFSKMLEN